MKTIVPIIFAIVCALVTSTTQLTDFVQVFGHYGIFDDTSMTHYYPLTRYTQTNETIFEMAHSIKMPRKAIPIRIWDNNNLIYKLPYGQFIFVRPPKSICAELNIRKHQCDTIYTPTNREIFDLLDEFKIVRTSNEKLEELRCESREQYVNAYWSNYLINLCSDIENMIKSRELIYSGVNRIIIKDGIKILLFNIKHNDLKHITSMVSCAKQINVDATESYNYKNYYIIPDSISGLIYFDDNHIYTIYDSRHKDESISPRLIIQLPLETQFINFGYNTMYQIYDLSLNQYVILQNMFYPPIDSFPIKSDTIYEPSYKEILSFFREVDLTDEELSCYTYEELREKKSYSKDEYIGAFLIHTEVLNYITKLNCVLNNFESNCPIEHREHRMIIKSGIKVLLFNINPNNIDNLVQTVSNLRILKIDDENLSKIKSSQWYQQQDSTQILHLFTSPEYNPFCK